MRVDIQKGRYLARHAATAEDLRACQALRHRCFFGVEGVDQDRFDPSWQHLMVEDGVGGPLVCTLRFQICSGADVLDGYAAMFYDLEPFAEMNGPAIEIGRFCSDPGTLDPHVLRVAWGAVTQIVDATAATLVFGCTSFAGVNPAVYSDVFARLRTRHLGPDALRPCAKVGKYVALSDVMETSIEQSPMPALLRTYLAMGGWVSDQAVIDADMQTLHILTALEVASVPPARAQALRALV